MASHRAQSLAQLLTTRRAPRGNGRATFTGFDHVRCPKCRAPLSLLMDGTGPVALCGCSATPVKLRAHS